MDQVLSNKGSIPHLDLAEPAAHNNLGQDSLQRSIATKAHT